MITSGRKWVSEKVLNYNKMRMCLFGGNMLFGCTVARYKILCEGIVPKCVKQCWS